MSCLTIRLSNKEVIYHDIVKVDVPSSLENIFCLFHFESRVKFNNEFLWSVARRATLSTRLSGFQNIEDRGDWKVSLLEKGKPFACSELPTIERL